jgi:hypothetical protein
MIYLSIGISKVPKPKRRYEMATQVRIEEIRVKMCMGWDESGKMDVSALLPVRMCPMCGSHAEELHIFSDGLWYSSYDVGTEHIICCMSLEDHQLARESGTNPIDPVINPLNLDDDEAHYLYTEFGILTDDDDEDDTL